VTRSPERYALLGAALLLLGVLVWYHGAALLLPESLIDDATHIANSDRLWRNLHSGGIKAAIRGDISVTARLYNPGLSIINALAYTVTGENPMMLHALRLLLLAMVCCVLLFLPRVVLADVSAPAWFSAPLGGLAAALMFATAEYPGAHDFQALQANWYRLHATDALPVSLAAVHFLLLHLAARWKGRRRGVAEIASAGFLCVAITAKVTAVCYVAALTAAALLMFVVRDARRASWCRVAAYVCVFCALYFPLLWLMRSHGPQGGYGTNYELSVHQFRISAAAFVSMYWRTFGLILVATAMAFTMRIILTCVAQKDLRGVIRANIPQLHLWLAWFLATGAYLLWKHNIPRYMLPGLLPLCAAAGIEITAQIEWARAQPRLRQLPWFVAGIGAALMPTKFLIGFTLMLTFARGSRDMVRRFVALNLGVLAAGWAFFLVTGFVSNRAMKTDMVAVEHAQVALMENTADLLRRGMHVGFLGDADDEHIGSMSFLIERRKGISKPIPLVTADAQTSGLDYLLFGEKLNTAVQPSAIARATVWKEFRGAGAVRTPLDFWEWRRSLWHRQFVPPWRTEPLKNAWVILSLNK
jgi:hypothetical protein